MIFNSDKCLLHNPDLEFAGNSSRRYPERPGRVKKIVDVLQHHGIDTVTPSSFDRSWIERVHLLDYVDFIASIPDDLDDIAPTAINVGGNIHPESSWHASLGHYFFDPATPVMGKTAVAAFSAVDCSLSMAKNLKEGSALSAALCRPPGHHAMRDRGGGYCIFNNIAIAAEFLRDAGKSVSILDLDYHHGNGTQQLFYHRDDVQYVSIHADTRSNYPFYWGFKEEVGEDVGRGFTINLPVDNTASPSTYLTTLDQSLEVVQDYDADIVLVSMGFDCYIDDPIAGLTLTKDHYQVIGEKLQDFEQVGLVLEGGYAIDAIGDCFYNVFNSLRG